MYMKLTYKSSKDIKTIFEYLTDMQKFTSVHPVIYKIENIGNGNFKVFETLKIGFIPISFTYPVIIKSDLNTNHVEMKATVMKMNKVAMSFQLKVVDGLTIIEEEIKFNTFYPFTLILENIFKTQHKQLFENIENQ